MTIAARDAVAPRVRHVRPPDLLPVYRLEQRCFSEPWSFEAFQTHVEAPGFLVAEIGSGLVGFVVGTLERGFPGPTGHIKDLAVHPDHRRQGLGRELLVASLRRLERAGAVRATLEVRQSNEAALALYRDLGFAPSRERPGYYADGEMAVVMTRSLE